MSTDPNFAIVVVATADRTTRCAPHAGQEEGAPQYAWREAQVLSGREKTTIFPSVLRRISYVHATRPAEVTRSFCGDTKRRPRGRAQMRRP